MIKLALEKRLEAADGPMTLALDLAIESGAFVTLYGTSGAGKTSTLRMLAGLMKPEKGQIIMEGETWFDSSKKINLKPQSRNIGFVFQDYALFPNMTIRENLSFALTKNQSPKIVSELISFMELGKLQDRKPSTLSGGQKQRVALARALVQQPKLLLLDEPLSALDIKIRAKLQDYLLKIHQEFNLTSILISHDIGEIVKLSDKVFVLEKGKLINQGNPADIFTDQPLGGKFKLVGDILKIEKQEVVYIITVLIQTNIVKVVADESEIVNMKIGDKVMVVSKAFNPIVYKIE